MQQEYLSNTELYYTVTGLIGESEITIKDDDAKHISQVMRHKEGDLLYVTDGAGNIFKGKINTIFKNEICLSKIDSISYKNDFENISFCLPRLKNVDRFEFALEKCIELGITNFIVFDSDFAVAKGEKLERWLKIGIAAMKQSLRAFIPKISFHKNIDSLSKQCTNLIYFEQTAAKPLDNFLLRLDKNIEYCFIFGPEGGFSKREFDLLNDKESLFLTKNRLRAETAIVAAASKICIFTKS